MEKVERPGILWHEGVGVGLHILKPERVRWLHQELSRAPTGRWLFERDERRNRQGGASRLRTASSCGGRPPSRTWNCRPCNSACPLVGGGLARARLGHGAEFVGSLEQIGARAAAGSGDRDGAATMRRTAGGHPLARNRVPGSQLSYLVEAACGPLLVLSFAVPPSLELPHVQRLYLSTKR